MLSSLTSVLFNALPIVAGPGAVVYACLNLQVKPSTNFTALFEVNPNSGANKCMSSVGHSVIVDVSESGATCGEVGYVEAKASSSGGDLCASDESIWNVLYYTKDLPSSKSGSVRSRWYKLTWSNANEITFKENEYIAGAMVCPTEALCSSTIFHWRSGSTGPAYLVSLVVATSLGDIMVDTITATAIVLTGKR
ncbi:hypothetical protein GGR57DRAFT_519979 [Xylariaceae sp. FL1272]|nr:hypothetical protein GGR57DRAFT_519979 [Xylariaceae sp. FL1272]